MSVFWSSLLWFIAGGAVGALISFVLTRRKVQKELDENPPVTPEMIRAMYMQMGRKPSEAQINQVINAMNRANTNKKKTDSKKTKTKAKK
jgi:uncharacterized protein YneF (UPF0154 family)